MPQLEPPSRALHRSFIEALAEFQAENRNLELDLEGLANPTRFDAYLGHLRALSQPGTHLPTGWVPSTELWFLEGEQFLGRLLIRHRLTETLRLVGGHIGYEVRPSARRQGHGTEMLFQALPQARRLGIDPALVTCDIDNIASRRVIEANGGVLAEKTAAKLRFWVPTS